jgi:hypothetical protein
VRRRYNNAESETYLGLRYNLVFTGKERRGFSTGQPLTDFVDEIRRGLVSGLWRRG